MGESRRERRGGGGGGVCVCGGGGGGGGGEGQQQPTLVGAASQDKLCTNVHVSLYTHVRMYAV